MNPFRDGDKVVCIDTFDSNGHLAQGQVYTVERRDDTMVCIQGRWWLPKRFMHNLNPCVEVGVNLANSTDWKSRYDDAAAKLTETTKQKNWAERDARFARDEVKYLEEKLAAAEAKNARQDRALFLATHYNWHRRGLTMADVARDMWNYIRQAVGEPPVPETEPLLPPRTYSAKVASVWLNDRFFKPLTEVNYTLRLAKNIEKKLTKDFDDLIIPKYDGQ